MQPLFTPSPLRPSPRSTVGYRPWLALVSLVILSQSGRAWADLPAPPPELPSEAGVAPMGQILESGPEPLDPLRAALESPAGLERAWRAASADQLLTEARDRIAHGDYAGAGGRLQVLRSRGLMPNLGAQVEFELGRVFELQGAYREAISRYEQVITSGHATPPIEADATYRAALCESELGELRAARKRLRGLTDHPGVGAAGRGTLALEDAFLRLQLAPRPRRMVALAEAIEALPAETAGWTRARGLYGLARAELLAVADLDLAGDERAARHLRERAEAMRRAEDRIAEIARMQEPEYLFKGILVLGDAHRDLARELMATPPPRRLTPDQDQIWREEVDKKARVVSDKALHFYELGLQRALDIGWGGPERAVLAERRDAQQREG